MMKLFKILFVIVEFFTFYFSLPCVFTLPLLELDSGLYPIRSSDCFSLRKIIKLEFNL